jgi:hypothetical protein
MSKVVDKAKVQQALDRAARNAKRGSAEVRAGKLLVGRDSYSGQFVTRGRDKVLVQSSAKKK